jgi:hypothetical protein
MAAARIQRWAMILGGYIYTIKYRPSAMHGNADALSRLPCKLYNYRQFHVVKYFLLNNYQFVLNMLDIIQRKILFYLKLCII